MLAAAFAAGSVAAWTGSPLAGPARRYGGELVSGAGARLRHHHPSRGSRGQRAGHQCAGIGAHRGAGHRLVRAGRTNPHAGRRRALHADHAAAGRCAGRGTGGGWLLSGCDQRAQSAGVRGVFRSAADLVGGLSHAFRPAASSRWRKPAGCRYSRLVGQWLALFCGKRLRALLRHRGHLSVHGSERQLCARDDCRAGLYRAGRADLRQVAPPASHDGPA